ncbi:MAG: phosphohistidine phosphatase SixA [Candidatus Aminicenantes bacterium]
MKLYLVQHGLSLSGEVDPEKSLSPEGESESRKIAAFLKEKNVRVDLVWHSSKKRAVQTARIMAEMISRPETQERKDLNPMDPVGSFPGRIEKLNKDLMIVSHLPFVQKLAALLLSGAEEKEMISVRNSGIVCLEHTDSWKVLWAVIPELLEGKGSPAEFDSAKFGC